MSHIMFDWRPGLNADNPSVTGGRATWVHKRTNMRREKYFAVKGEAMTVDAMMQEAYRAGAHDGVAEVCERFTDVLKEFR